MEQNREPASSGNSATHFALLVTNQCGVLARVTAAVSATSANIQHCLVSSVSDSVSSISDSVASISNPGLALISIRIYSSRDQALAVRRKLSRLIEVVELASDLDQEFAPMLRASDLANFLLDQRRVA